MSFVILVLVSCYLFVVSFVGRPKFLLSILAGTGWELWCTGIVG